MDDYPKIAHNVPISNVYVLVLDDWVRELQPPPGWDLEVFRPCERYITSGDAVQKSHQLYRDIYTYAGQARRVFNRLDRKPTKADLEFEKLCWKSAGAVQQLKSALIRARGTAVFMETEWADDDGQRRLLCIPKNPRLKNRG